jgi:NADH-quinone oxidoreductase subunit L
MALAFMAAIAGFINLPKTFGGGLWFGKWTENVVFEETVLKAHFEPPFNFSLAIVASLCGLAGLAVGVVYNRNFGGDLGIVRRNKFARAIHTFLKNKYYLDVLWTDIIVGSIKGPIAKTAYWFNQSILDGVVNSAGQTATATGRFVYKFIDQGVIDGVVNGSGRTASTGGGILRVLQNGRVQSYAALLLGSTGLIGLALVLFT